VSGPDTVVFADAAAVDTDATIPSPGVYVLRLSADDGGLVASDDVSISSPGAGGQTELDIRVAAASDDAEESDSGSVNLGSNDLDIVDNGGAGLQTVGLRFNGVAIPPGATILDAHVQFQADESDLGPTSLLVQGEDADNAQTFASSDGNISSRADTTATVNWAPPDWTTVGANGEDQRTPDISTIIQEIVDRDGWTDQSALALTISGTGKRTAESYNGKAGSAPLLHVEYTVPPANSPPTATDSTVVTDED